MLLSQGLTLSQSSSNPRRWTAVGLVLSLALAVTVACQAPGTDHGAGAADSRAHAGGAASDTRSSEARATLAEVPLIPRAVLFGNPERTSVRISPDGSRLAFLAPVDGVLNAWIQSIDGGEARAVTEFTDRPITGLTWAWNGEQLLFMKDRGGNENFHVFAVDIDTAEVRDLTPKDGVRAMIFATDRDRPDEILVQMNAPNPQLMSVYRLDTRTGETTLVQENDGWLGYLADEDWNIRGRTKMTEDGGQLFQMRDPGGAWFEFLTIPPEDGLTTQPTTFSEDGSTLYGISSIGRDKACLVAWRPTAGGGSDPRILFTSDEADVSSAIGDPTTNEPVAVAVNYLRPRWHVLDDSVREDLEALRGLDEGSFGVSSRTRDDRTWIVGYDRDDAAPVYWLWNRDSREGRKLFTSWPELEDQPLVEMRGVEVPTRDGFVMPSYLSVPPVGDGPHPMVLFVHGGPWGRDGWGYNSYHQWLANRGYAVLSPNFRGSTGFGKAFLNAGNREWYHAMQDDLNDAVAWAIAEGHADPERVAIMGGSYGGYATLAGLTRDAELFACGVDIVGPSHVGTLLRSIPPYWAPMLKMFETRVGSLDETEWLDSISPLTHVDSIEDPLLIGQGANDPRVKIAESDQIVEAMNRRGLPVTYVVFPDEGHGFRRPENSMAFNAVTEVFLAEHLGGRFEPIGDDVAKSTAEVRDKGGLELPGVVEASGAASGAASP